MARKKRKTTRKKTRSRKAKPIGFTKVGKKYALVFGTKSKPRLSKSRFSSKKTLTAKAKTYFK